MHVRQNGKGTLAAVESLKCTFMVLGMYEETAEALARLYANWFLEGKR